MYGLERLVFVALFGLILCNEEISAFTRIERHRFMHEPADEKLSDSNFVVLENPSHPAARFYSAKMGYRDMNKKRAMIAKPTKIQVNEQLQKMMRMRGCYYSPINCRFTPAALG